ncbi:MAG TPA: serine O-acetyltransferase, partial [Pseudomonadales bacterium]|nr:serine O-acetyltransferase [Pseudomonadales bacterium]
MTQQLWKNICAAAREEAAREAALSSFLHNTVLRHRSLCEAVGFLLADKLGCQALPSLTLQEVFAEAFAADTSITAAVARDIDAIFTRDPVCLSHLQALLFYKGLHALTAWRVAHWLWQQDRKALAYFLQNRISMTFAVDIHPAARIGSGVMLDHATGIVIGETATVADDVSILQDVTLGGTGKETGDRHPKIGAGVLIGPGSKILGNIEIGYCAQIAAGSVILKPVPHNALMAGVPAKQIGQADCAQPALEMHQTLG